MTIIAAKNNSKPSAVDSLTVLPEFRQLNVYRHFPPIEVQALPDLDRLLNQVLNESLWQV